MWSNLEGLNVVAPESTAPSPPAGAAGANVAELLSTTLSDHELARQLDAWINTPLRMDAGAQPAVGAESRERDDAKAASSEPQMVFSQMYQTYKPNRSASASEAPLNPDLNDLLMQIVNGGPKERAELEAAQQQDKKEVVAPADAVSEPSAKRPRADSFTEDISLEDDKRRRNTAASARFRIKKKQREEAMKRQAQELEEKVSLMGKELESLRAENRWLRSLVLEKSDSAPSA